MGTSFGGTSTSLRNFSGCRPGTVIIQQSTSTGRTPVHQKAETPLPAVVLKTSDQIVPENGRHNPRRSAQWRKPRQL